MLNLKSSTNKYKFFITKNVEVPKKEEYNEFSVDAQCNRRALNKILMQRVTRKKARRKNNFQRRRDRPYKKNKNEKFSFSCEVTFVI